MPAKPKRPADIKPGFTPRKAEIDAIVAVASADYKDAATAGRAILSEAFRLFTERSWWIVVNRLGLEPGTPILWGVFGTETAAQRAIDANTLQTFGYAQTAKVTGIRERREQILERELELNPTCTECGHWGLAHHERAGRCYVQECKCAHYERPPSAAAQLQAY